MISPSRRYRRVEGVLCQRVGESTVILNPHNGQYYSLDDVGDRVWNLIDGSRTIAEVVTIITKEYDAPFETVRVDVGELVEDMEKQRLLVGDASLA